MAQPDKSAPGEQGPDRGGVRLHERTGTEPVDALFATVDLDPEVSSRACSAFGERLLALRGDGTDGYDRAIDAVNLLADLFGDRTVPARAMTLEEVIAEGMTPREQLARHLDCTPEELSEEHVRNLLTSVVLPRSATPKQRLSAIALANTWVGGEDTTAEEEARKLGVDARKVQGLSRRALRGILSSELPQQHLRRIAGLDCEAAVVDSAEHAEPTPLLVESITAQSNNEEPTPEPSLPAGTTPSTAEESMPPVESEPEPSSETEGVVPAKPEKTYVGIKPDKVGGLQPSSKKILGMHDGQPIMNFEQFVNYAGNCIVQSLALTKSAASALRGLLFRDSNIPDGQRQKVLDALGEIRTHTNTEYGIQRLGVMPGALRTVLDEFLVDPRNPKTAKEVHEAIYGEKNDVDPGITKRQLTAALIELLHVVR